MGFRFLGMLAAFAFLLPKGCGKSSGDDGGAGLPEAASTATAAASDTASAAPSASAAPTTHAATHAAGAKDAGGADASVADAGKGDAGDTAAKGTLPPKIDAPPADNNDKGPFAHYDAATLATKVHARDPMLNACYTSTGKDPGYWAPRCYELHFGADGNVTSVTGKATDPLGLCIKGALLGVQLGAPKDKAAGKAGICMTTR